LRCEPPQAARTGLIKTPTRHSITSLFPRYIPQLHKGALCVSPENFLPSGQPTFKPNIFTQKRTSSPLRKKELNR
ncbi:MAG: hypothetical protein RML37_05230, partial [Chitinophagales bacterium]|nr:hypothetical protein [Chitinophagales bacterium]